MVKVGQKVSFVDPKGVTRDALVTAEWGPKCINVVFVSDDATRQDSYGQQIERSTSLVHRQSQQAHGNYWYAVSEDEVTE